MYNVYIWYTTNLFLRVIVCIGVYVYVCVYLCMSLWVYVYVHVCYFVYVFFRVKDLLHIKYLTLKEKRTRNTLWESEREQKEK